MKTSPLSDSQDHAAAGTVEPWCIVGRRSSHYTRLARLFAEEVGRPCRLLPVTDLSSLSPDSYGGNPALKLPVLRTEGGSVFGAENICRVLARGREGAPRIVWPEDVVAPLVSNAQELAWSGMQAQVQLAFGGQIAALPPENIFVRKAAAGLGNTLRWLDENLAAALSSLPAARDLSLLEATLFCLFEHVRFRGTVPTHSYPALSAFSRTFAGRPSAVKTPYGFDTLPAGSVSG